MLGYIETVGVDDENRYESRIYPDNYFEGVTEAMFGSLPLYHQLAGTARDFAIN